MAKSPGIYVSVVDNSQYTAPTAGAAYSTASVAATLSGPLYEPTMVYSYDQFNSVYGSPRHTSAYYNYALISVAPVLMTRVAAVYPNFDFENNYAATPTTAQNNMVAYLEEQGYDHTTMTYDDVIKDRTYYKVVGFKSRVMLVEVDVTPAIAAPISEVLPAAQGELFYNDNTKVNFMYSLDDGVTWNDFNGTLTVDPGTGFDILVIDDQNSSTAADWLAFYYDSGSNELGLYVPKAYNTIAGVAYPVKIIALIENVSPLTPARLISETDIVNTYSGLTFWFESKYPGKDGADVDIKITPVTYGVRDDGDYYIKEAYIKVLVDNVVKEDFGVVSFNPNDTNWFVPYIEQSAYIEKVYFNYDSTSALSLSDDFTSDITTYDYHDVAVPSTLFDMSVNMDDLDFYIPRELTHGFEESGTYITVGTGTAGTDITNVSYTEYTYLPEIYKLSTNYVYADTAINDLYSNLDPASAVTIDNPDDIFQGASVDGGFYEITANTVTVSTSDLTTLFQDSVDYAMRYKLTDDTLTYTLLTAPFDDDTTNLTIFNALKYTAEFKLVPFFIYDMLESQVLTVDSAVAYSNRLDSTWHGAVVWDYTYLYNKYIGRKVLMYPSIELAFDIMYSATNYKIWYAPAGQRRGIAGPSTELRSNPNKTDRDVLYGYPNRVNPLINVSGFGIMLYGQKTLQTTTSKLDRINVAMLVKYLVRRVNEVLPPMLFEFNDATFNAQIESLLRPIYEELYYNRGTTSMPYTDIKTTAFDAAQKRAVIVIHIEPTDVVEEIQVSISVDSSGVTEVSVG